MHIVVLALADCRLCISESAINKRHKQISLMFHGGEKMLLKNYFRVANQVI